MTNKPKTREYGAPVTVIGLGAMGSALASTLFDSGYRVTVWNRTPGRAGPLRDHGAVGADTMHEAVEAGGPVIVCLFDHGSVHQTLNPVAEILRDRSVINLTTTTPEEAREITKWAQEQGIVYLDGAIMATPPMIGAEGGQNFYSGSGTVFDDYRHLLDA